MLLEDEDTKIFFQKREVQMKTQKGAFMHGLDNMIIKDIPIPHAGPGNVVVSLEYIGICGSDVHYYHNGSTGSFKVDLSQDFMLGHECAGTVIEVGEGVKKLKVGDRVALEPGVPDGTCDFCKRGLYNLCKDVVFLATPPVQGCNMEYIEFPEDYCFVLPDNVSTKEGALIEPLAVGLHAANFGDVQVGDTVAIFGCGCIGLTTAMSARARGAGRIIMCDIVDVKVEKALNLIADDAFNSLKKDPVEEILRLTDGKGADCVFECAGVPETIQNCIYVVASAGTVVFEGMPVDSDITLDFANIMSREITMRSIFRYRNLFPKALSAVANGSIKVGEIVTHEFPFSEIDAAYQEALTNKTDLVKAVIKVK